MSVIDSVDSVTADQNMTFDVPLSLPPPPSPHRATKRSAPSRLYVCPLCGDNALASLRERDEHLQSAHNGELVFPCQICGLAYPLYIALRRHAALKHNSDYDLVRYGPPELLETESIECPECQLVAFTDRNVLKLHLAEVHKMDSERVKIAMKQGYLKTSMSNFGAAHGRGGFPRRSGPRTGRARTHYISRASSAPVSRLERVLSKISGDPSPVCCRICRMEADNIKEFKLHYGLDHVDNDEDCEQLGCQACGRIFFGAGGRIDLIGHLRVLHQESDQSPALCCPHVEQPTRRALDDDQTHLCEAFFSSPRLRHLHSTVSGVMHPGFACPLKLDLPEYDSMDPLSLSDHIRSAILETEMSADREGLIILAYCCPGCSRVFAGHDAPNRFAVHQQVCQALEISVQEPTSDENSQNVLAKVEPPQTIAISAANQIIGQRASTATTQPETKSVLKAIIEAV
ncbi:unnamed protein product [Calicophoron daubneyi]|uniref:C2H2-type domain-containing protein n=1 Tax=Calicophoron daubneyi TaxID=300641 RepID=A0AAV2T3R2_CALDB